MLPYEQHKGGCGCCRAARAEEHPGRNGNGHHGGTGKNKNAFHGGVECARAEKFSLEIAVGGSQHLGQLDRQDARQLRQQVAAPDPGHAVVHPA